TIPKPFHFLILLLQNKFVKTHLHHSLCTRNGEGSNRGFYEGFFKTLNMLFNSSHPTVLSRGTNGWMPRNTFERKLVEFYSNFDNAVDNLVNVVANGGFLKFAKVVK
ncbi:MAG: hypothetical protein MUO82_06445, partial [Candidatus Thermoplasmatota archaeon]|nr:hypothetical protein [Candidatus Thermoplasmatota archaeon]